MESEIGHPANSTGMSEESTIKLRSYQQEMLEASLKRNVIVAMDTGSGKTHVAVFRILAQLEKDEATKLVWFMSPSVALSMQQYEVLKASLTGYLVKSLTGSDGVDKWTEQRLWDAVLTNVRVVVGTPAVLADALTHGFVQMSRLTLLVFDEAHRCIKGSPMNTVMKNFYHPAKAKGSSVPSILGLTASPVMSAKSGSLDTVEANLDATTITPKLHRPELEQFVHPPDVTSVLYAAQPASAVPAICHELWKALKSYSMSSDPYVVYLRELNDDESRARLNKVATKGNTYCYSQLKMLQQRSDTLLEQLGPSAAQMYVERCMERFNESKASSAFLLPDVTEHEKRHLSSIFKEITKAASLSQPSSSDKRPLVTAKIQSLIDLLTEHISPTFRGIVFAEQRAVVTTLAALLRENPSLNTNYSIGSFVGTSNPASRKTNFSDIVDLKRQEQDMADFRSGKINLMIATNVWEEGIDVPACNMVLCFDPPKNLVSFVQRRGRARQRDSKYIVFLALDDPNATSGKWQKLEAEMKKAYMNELRALPLLEPDDEAALSSKFYRVPSTGALLTLENAKSHLYRFCSVSVSNRYDPRPEFETTETEQSNGSLLHTGQVTLPSFVHPDLRTAQSSQAWRSPDAAIKDASFQAYTALHRAGLVNDNLLPLTRDYGPEVGQIHVDQPSIVHIPERQSPWRALFKSLRFDNTTWHAATLTISSANTSIISVLLWAPTKLCSIEPFKLYWNEDITYTVEIQGLDYLSLPESSQLARNIHTFTAVMLRSVYKSRMTTDSNDFPILFSDGDIINTNGVNDAFTGCFPASNLDSRDIHPLDCGLIRVGDQTTSAFIFSSITQSDAMATDVVQDDVIVTPFPKRRDFLHPVPSLREKNNLHTAKHSFPIQDCSVDRLPAKYALLAAFVPSIMHRIDVALLVQSLQSTLLQDASITDVSLITEAITSPMAGEAKDYNRLEFLGDTILKFCAVLQATAQHPKWPERYLTLEKSRIVSNKSLTTTALAIGLDRYILTKHLKSTKWKPVYVSDLIGREEETKREVSSKVLADVVEALIGAAYVDGGMVKAFSCLKALLPTEKWYKQADSIDILIGELDHWPQPSFGLLERLIGHQFRNPNLLVEAMTHSSFPNDKTVLSYERLEFLGDAVLDLIIVPKLFAHPRNLKHWELHQIREVLVNGYYLAYCCMNYAIGEEKFDIIEDPVRATSHLEVKKATRLVHLHDFLRAGRETMQNKQGALKMFERVRHDIDRRLESSRKYPWPDLIAMQAPKFLSDIVESVLGALYLDSRGDLAVCEAFIEKLGILKHMRRILDDGVRTMSPKERLGVAAGNDVVEYRNGISESADGSKTFDCEVMVGGMHVSRATGCGSKEEAEARVAHAASKMLEAKESKVVMAGRKRKHKVESEMGGYDTESDVDVDVVNEMG